MATLAGGTCTVDRLCRVRGAKAGPWVTAWSSIGGKGPAATTQRTSSAVKLVGIRSRMGWRGNLAVVEAWDVEAREPWLDGRDRPQGPSIVPPV